MNKIRSILLTLVIAIQVSWLVVHYADGFRELDKAPRLRVACDFYDPHDFFRGDYTAFHCWQDITPEHGVEGSALDQESGAEVFLFWKKDADGLWKVARAEKLDSANEAAKEGEVRTLGRLVANDAPAPWQITEQQKKEGELRPFVYLMNRGGETVLRFYLPERRADLRKAWCHAHPSDRFPTEHYKLTADIVVRQDGSLVPTMLYVNGIPWLEAFQRIEQGAM